jgi:hypothetical protein
MKKLKAPSEIEKTIIELEKLQDKHISHGFGCFTNQEDMCYYHIFLEKMLDFSARWIELKHGLVKVTSTLHTSMKDIKAKLDS